MNRKAFLSIVALVVSTLSMVGCPPDANDLMGDRDAGETLYDNNCASCHRVGSYDTDGTAPDLVGRSDITAGFVSRHRNLSWIPQDVADFRTFLTTK